jgi:hypothetical protein
VDDLLREKETGGGKRRRRSLEAEAEL